MSLPDPVPTIIEQTVEALSAQPSGSRQLLLILGEQHKTTAHRMIEAQVLNTLHAMNIPATLAIEVPSNYMQQYLQEEKELSAPDAAALAARIEANDKNGHLRAESVIGNEHYEADMCALLRTAMRNGQSVILADNPRNPNDKLHEVDLAAPRTREAVERLGLENSADMRSLSADGVYLRNTLMLDACRDALDAAKGPHVVILCPGKLHVSGSAPGNTQDGHTLGLPTVGLAYDQSILGLATQQGIPARAVMLGEFTSPTAAAPAITAVNDKIGTPALEAELGFSKYDVYGWRAESKARLDAAIEDTKGSRGPTPAPGHKP